MPYYTIYFKKKFCQRHLDFQALMSDFTTLWMVFSKSYLHVWHGGTEIFSSQEIVWFGFICAEWEQIKFTPVTITVVF